MKSKSKLEIRRELIANTGSPSVEWLGELLRGASLTCDFITSVFTWHM